VDEFTTPSVSFLHQLVAVLGVVILTASC